MEHAAAMGCYLGSKGGCPSPAPAVSHNNITGAEELLTAVVRPWTSQGDSTRSIADGLKPQKRGMENQMRYIKRFSGVRLTVPNRLSCCLCWPDMTIMRSIFQSSDNQPVFQILSRRLQTVLKNS